MISPGIMKYDRHQKKFRLIHFTLWLLMIVSATAATPFPASDRKQIYEAEKLSMVGGAKKLYDDLASGDYLVVLARSGDGLVFTNTVAANKLAIRYASVSVGTISVAVNDQKTTMVNIHSSGAAKGSFLYSIIDISIPSNGQVKIYLDRLDASVNIDQILTGDGDLGLAPDIWNLPPLPVAAGPYPSDWEGLSRMYSVPAWWREAKFGAWAHWDPQSMPEKGDWYARKMYLEGDPVYAFHESTFGHPSVYGYKDICHNWIIDRWDPEEMMNLFVEMGARYFMAMGVHHDNFDCWDSKFQPWNSVNVGPREDVVGTWEKLARSHGLRFGIGFHNTPPRTWGQFMPVRYTGDKSGPKKDVPYDALQTVLDGKGKWWEGMDPVDLYGPAHSREDDPLHSPFANQFMWRIDDAIGKYHPDIIYFDEHAGDSQVDLGVHMGLGILAPQLIANYYNKSLKWNEEKMDVVVNLKGVGGRWNSFQNNPELLPLVDRSLVKSTEVHIEPEIMAYPFQTETSIAEWHYNSGMKYMDAKRVIELLMENVSRNGTMLFNLTQHGRGDLDQEVIQTAKDIGAWLKVNGQAIYGSRPFEVYGENRVRYTRNNGYVYATILNWADSAITLKALHADGNTIGKIFTVEMLGSDVEFDFRQDVEGLTVSPKRSSGYLPGIANQSLAANCRVLRITHDKGWFNDDDPGVIAPGWMRHCNLGDGDFNNDLSVSENVGDVWTCSFNGTSISVIAPKRIGFGKIEIAIDQKIRATVDLSTEGGRKIQQLVFEETGLTQGKHSLSIVNRGPGEIAIDAIIVR